MMAVKCHLRSEEITVKTSHVAVWTLIRSMWKTRIVYKNPMFLVESKVMYSHQNLNCENFIKYDVSRKIFLMDKPQCDNSFLFGKNHQAKGFLFPSFS